MNVHRMTSTEAQKTTFTGVKAEELANLIVDVVTKENYLHRDELVGRIKGMITAFRLRSNASTYQVIEEPNQVQRLIRANELMNLEREFWKNQLRGVVGNDAMTMYYEDLDNERTVWNNQPPAPR